jgi:hypothetical protein
MDGRSPSQYINTVINWTLVGVTKYALAVLVNNKSTIARLEKRTGGAPED